MAVDKISRERWALTPLLPLVDDYFDRSEFLKVQGWFSFEPYWKFRQSLCTHDQWLIFKRFHIELMKERMGDYCSDFLNDLRKDAPDPRLVATECDRVHLKLDGTAAYDDAWSPFEREQMHLRRKEVSLHATHISRERDEEDEKLKRIRIWREVVKELCEPLGFYTKSKMTSRSAPIFRTNLTDKWDCIICVETSALGTETAETIIKPEGMGPLPIGGFSWWRAVVPKNKSKVSDDDPDTFIVPQYFLPISQSYDFFGISKDWKLILEPKLVLS